MLIKNFCLKCGEKVQETTNKCACGGTCFAYGTNINIVNKKVVCDCGCNEYKVISHLELEGTSIFNYRCAKCKNVIGIERHIEK